MCNCLFKAVFRDSFFIFSLSLLVVSHSVAQLAIVDSVVKDVAPSHSDVNGFPVTQRADISSPTVVSITKNELSQFGTISDLVNDKVPGTVVRTHGGIGSYARLSIRGLSGDRVAVYVDDVLMNSASGSYININTLPMSLFSRVEIFKGGLDIDMPGTISAGAIKLYSSNGEEGSHAHGSLGIGSYGYLSGNGGFALMRHSYSLVGSGSYESADNGFKYLKNPTPLVPGSQYSAQRINDSILNMKGTLFARKTFDNMSRLSGKFHYGYSRKGIAGNLVTENDKAWLAENSVSGECEWSVPPLTFPDIKLKIKSRFSRYETYYPQKIISYTTGRTIHRIDDEYGVEGSFLAGLNLNENWRVSFVASGGTEGYIPFDMMAPISQSIGASRLNGGAGVSIERTLARFVPFVRIRYDGVLSQADQINNDAFTLVDSTKKTSAMNVISGSIGSSYVFDSSGSIGILFSRRKQLPSFYQLFGDRGLSLGNPNLRPEDVRLFEVFGKKNWTHGRMNMNGEASLFYTNSLDAIVSYIYMTGGQIRWLNADASTNVGVELTLDLHWSRLFHYSLVSTIQNPVNHSKSSYTASMYNNKRMPGESVYNVLTKFTVELPYQTDVWHTVKFMGDYYSDLSNDHVLHYFPASIMHDFGISFGYLSFGQIYFRIENITDQQNFDAFGHPVPGRMFFSGILFRRKQKN